MLAQSRSSVVLDWVLVVSLNVRSNSNIYEPIYLFYFLRDITDIKLQGGIALVSIVFYFNKRMRDHSSI